MVEVGDHLLQTALTVDDHGLRRTPLQARPLLALVGDCELVCLPQVPGSGRVEIDAQV